MVGVYFSSTGNTKHCIYEFLKSYGGALSAVSIEDESARNAISKNDFIVFAYPIYFSSLPKIVCDFIENNKEIFMGKKIFIIATMGLFSGDGAGCSARLFKKYGAEIVGGLHLKMPDSICDEKILKRPLARNKQIVKDSETKINSAAMRLKNGKQTQEGLSAWHHIAGLFGQRLWFSYKTKRYLDKLKIDKSKCIRCGNCGKLCPMNNIDEGIVTKGKCTMCYRCVSNCPVQAITLLGKRVYEQCKIENYI